MNRGIEQEGRIQAEGYACLDDRPDPDDVFVERILECCSIFKEDDWLIGPESIPALLNRAAREWPAFIKERQTP